MGFDAALKTNSAIAGLIFLFEKCRWRSSKCGHRLQSCAEMPDMQRRTPENLGEIASFITEGTHRLATIAMNDYGFQLSARMAQTYLQRALQVLESQQSFDRTLIKEIGALKAVAKAIGYEYAQLEKFCAECERFSRQKTKNPVEWISKWVVRAISRGYLGTVSHHLAHKICTFHSRVCSVLVDDLVTAQ